MIGEHGAETATGFRNKLHVVLSALTRSAGAEEQTGYERNSDGPNAHIAHIPAKRPSCDHSATSPFHKLILQARASYLGSSTLFNSTTGPNPRNSRPFGVSAHPTGTPCRCDDGISSSVIIRPPRMLGSVLQHPPRKRSLTKFAFCHIDLPVQSCIPAAKRPAGVNSSTNAGAYFPDAIRRFSLPSHAGMGRTCAHTRYFLRCNCEPCVSMQHGVAGRSPCRSAR